jgi:hypothetical protein
LLVIAITKYEIQEEQAKALCISKATLARYLKRYELDYRTIRYSSKSKKV